MGEAKRRKALGLMPQVENLEVILHRDGRIEGDPVPPSVLERLTTWAETGARWDARYRTTFIGSGIPREMLKTEADLMDIPVPDRMRLRLGLLSGSAQWLAHEQELSPESFFDDGGQPRQLNVRATEYDYNGHWGEMPELEPDSTLRYLMQHPAVSAPPQGTEYVVTVWHGGERDAQTDIEPRPDAEHQGALIQAAQVFLGETDDEWLEDHLSNLNGLPVEVDETNEDAAPLARRLTLLLSPAPLVLSPTVQVLSRSGEMDVVYFQSQEAYSSDGQTWHDYPRPQDNRERLQALMESMGLGDLSELEAMLGEAGDTGDDGLDSRTLEAEVVSSGPADARNDARNIDADSGQPGDNREP